MKESAQKKTICSKKLEEPNNFFNTLHLSILCRNINRKRLKKIAFIGLCGLLTTHPDYNPWAYMQVGLKAR